ncbi:MFS transporter [Robertmurraya andreesenii]|uniref:MFS family arabinose efflux permease n=1 Tax=Anoxybacillus andreesenii TaxID=1325932 RepID=A0ABT9V8Z5_9BACL|nr:MFS transporter [Robertmurraya andreesenii]MDQ0157432.1 putative MFS family arabinose efflux permease [Robertmurraya andreesenii]
MSQLLNNRFVRVILLSALFLQIGIWVRNFAILLFVMEKTKGDPFAVSMISVAEFVPIFVFSFIGGTFADRWRPKRTMVWCDILSAVSVFAVLITLHFGSWKIIFFVTLISAILSQFSQPSGMKLFKMHLKPELIQSAMSIYQTIFAVFMVFGPVVGTLVFQKFGIEISIAITGVAFLLSAAMLTFIPKDHQMEVDQQGTSILDEMKSGIRYVLEKKELKLLGLCFLSAGLAMGLIQPLNVFIVTDRLDLAKESLQWLLVANGVGMILGGVVSVMFAKSVPPQRLLMIGMFVNAIGMSVIGFSTNLPLTLAAEFVCGLFFPCIQIGINTMILQNTKAEFIGRVNGTLSPLFTGAMVLTMSISGKMMEKSSIVTVFELSAFLFVIGLLVMLPLYNLKATNAEGMLSKE